VYMEGARAVGMDWVDYLELARIGMQ
jgi:hypothetical protein